MASASTWGWLKQGDVGISLVSWGDRRGLAALAGERDKAELVLEPGLSKEKRGETGINASCPAPGCSSSMARSRDTPPPPPLAVLLSGMGAQGPSCLPGTSIAPGCPLQWLMGQQLQPKAWFVAVQDALALLLCPHPCLHPCPCHRETVVATSPSPGRDRLVSLHIAISQTVTGPRASDATGTPQGPHDATGTRWCHGDPTMPWGPCDAIGD